MTKGFSPLISAVLLILIAITIAVMVSGWLTSLSQERATKLKNLTEEKLTCQYASLYIRNVSYECNDNCVTGAPYRINATIENTGTISLDITKIVTRLDTGQVYTSYSSGERISAGGITTMNFNDILVSDNNTHITYNVTHSNINYVRVYNSINEAIDTAGPLNGVSSYNNTLSNISISYKIEVEDINGNKIFEYYPFTSGSYCLNSSSIEKVTIASSTCPYTAIDSFYGSDVTFVNCTT